MNSTARFHYLQILLHLCAWLLLFLFPLLGRVDPDTNFLIRSLFNLSLLAAVFYLNSYLLIPRLLLKNKVRSYLFWVIVLVAAVLLIHFGYNQMVGVGASFPKATAKVYKSFRYGPVGRLMPHFFSVLFMLAVSTSVRLISEYLRKENEQKERDNEKLNSELGFLRSQINPHFLFNTLNNIYGLAATGSKDTEKAILKLSDLMRYMLEDALVEKVPLAKEIDYLKNFIELQKLRIAQTVEVQFTITGEAGNQMIEPMLLIPFIENAFKHGISYRVKSYIYIDLIIEEHKLSLKVENSLAPEPAERDSVSGIGLQNVYRRLDLLYPDKYLLNISKGESYIVNLEIQL
ncbi:MAG TPA: histidine kinase [Cytophagaceae bacterium]